ncbi:ribosome-associated GTPase EngA [Thermovibrio ammonificans HB-1]|uniref:GTPase Der n=1 Tax=Thermovibrio ammonificans (strain DSM 15698 / JCM 12110 / HB-1) TaxID=648996 RepID=E8T676_THEA1|nr:ribosome biogenesis GTPase Der [Thermovibrio ammonificans]ADU96660.1 ribosome-associated GTPase EngA [Thermovibrio ammonificans HB-1]
MKRLPVVAIVGRPNVGKSSLFNRLLGRKVAIIDNTPGVTRDRVVQEADIDEHKVVLVDTGGVVEKDAHEFAKETTEQAKRAMEEADVIVFVVDGQEGINPLDEEVAKLLRRWKKPVIVAVNKIDEPFMEDLVYDFYRLGFDEVIPISTIHKIGIPTLKEKILEKLPQELKESAQRAYQREEKSKKAEQLISGESPEELQELSASLERGEEYEIEEEEEKEPIKVAIVGRPNMGKSTLLNALVGEERAIVSDIPGTTRDAIDTYVRVGDDEFIFIDTAGIRRRGKIKDIEYYSYLRSLDAIDRADVVVLMVDAQEGPTERDAKIAGMALEKFKPIVIAVNKIDTLKDQKEWERLQRELDLVFDFIPFAPRVFISAKERKGLKELLKQIKDLYRQYTKKVRTGEFNRTLRELMEIHQPPVYKNKIVKIYYGTQVKTKPPTFLLFSNYPEGIPKSFRRFLENRLREKFGFNKIPIRIVFKKR